mmetsp:Transcript_9049/g.11118  ORF Transcript_9049/g.11118 Transcript_9049/m.11118 type:complete len:386 (-) Transcript_9049:73-1230(-)|eukprot:CAMPEP_0172514842 /NCGR_PEP_ID=MMETSP1066-20121228/263199_1 /TAXON_ID=671091 /ORGANISM="Coscinodiscus wailesii, Strain CCMP2513" /LENGTH=385 /DNA_ID=CAMNT_0013295669 /DNA_START=80 /DNA_END=1237 /DNA_ORIENTATION=-
MFKSPIFIVPLLLSFHSDSVSGFIIPNNSINGGRGTSTPSRLFMSSSTGGGKALIVQNKGGGHGELGYQLAKTLSSHPKISSITILQDDACDKTKEPFKSYTADLPEVEIIDTNLGFEGMEPFQIQSILGGRDASFDYVWDNASKSAKDGSCGKALCDAALSWQPKLFCYVSSAGMYLPGEDATFPMSEADTPIKESSGQAQFENYAASIGLPLVSFRPQYIYGVKSNKWSYLDWFFDRLCRGAPVPIPGDGSQKVSLTNSEDVASLLACPLNDEAAAVAQRVFNCGTDELVEYREVVKMCADAAGVALGGDEIRYYDKGLGKGTFPFRLEDFYVAPDLAKEKLGWGGPKHSLKDDLGWYFDSYKERGGPLEVIDFSKDEELIKG